MSSFSQLLALTVYAWSYLCLTLTRGQVPCPKIISREEWNARPPKSVEYLTHQPVPYVFIHHSSGLECFDPETCARDVVRGYQDFHMDVRGFCIAGDFMDHLPPQIQMDTAQALIDCGIALGKIQSNYTLRGHRDMVSTTDCPGDALYAEIHKWPHY